MAGWYAASERYGAFVEPARAYDGTDRALVQRFQAGDESAFEGVFRRHQDSVYGLCSAVLGDPERAEDAAQETFLRAYTNLAGLRCPDCLSPWLRKIAVNVCRAEMKCAARRPMLTAEGDVEALEPRTRSAEPARDVLQDEMVREVLAGLKPEFRLVLVLRDVQGLSYQEMAEATGCSLALVKVRLHRARKAFAQRFVAD